MQDKELQIGVDVSACQLAPIGANWHKFVGGTQGLDKSPAPGTLRSVNTQVWRC
jgi:hypothetical protein